MENEHNLINNFDFIEDNIFKAEYENQKIHKIKAFKNWQNSYLKKYGKNVTLFHCINDKIYFYISNSKCKEYPYYRVRCPKCNNYICYFCSSINSNEYYDCCMKRLIYSCFHIKDDYVDGPAHFLWFCCDSKLVYMIPFLNMIAIIGSIGTHFYYKCDCKFRDGYHEMNLKDNNKWNIMVFIHSMFALALSIAFFSNNIIFVLFIWIISCPFSCSPAEYLANLINNGFKG